MRLFDVRSEPDPILGGGQQRVSAATAAVVRYVLDLDASAACGQLIRSGDGLFDVDNLMFRMPADTFWLELFEERTAAMVGPNRKIGYLVETWGDGRSGTISPYMETNEGLRREVPVKIQFDLTGKLTPRKGQHEISHPHMDHLADLLRHCVLIPDYDRVARLSSPGLKSSDALRELAEGVWYALPLMFAFVALLNSPQVVETRQSDLTKLNRARVRRGRAPLMDHVEVRMALGETSGGSGSGGNSLRSPPRLHVVRGHLVHRDGKTFWRQAHLRGDSHKAIVAKTVRVTAGRSVRSDPIAHMRKAATYG